MASLASKLIKGSLFRIFNLVVIIGISFFMMPFVIKALGDRWYGLWIFAATIVGYYGFLDLGLSSAIQRFISQAIGKDNRTEINTIFNTSLFLFIIAGLLVLLISTVIVLLCPHFVDNAADVNTFRIVIFLIGLDVAISFPVRAFIGFLCANVRFDVVNTIDILKLLLRTALILYFLGRGHGIVSLALISISVDILQYLVTVIFVMSRFSGLEFSTAHIARDRVGKLFKYSVFTFISNVAERLRFHTDAFVITAFLGLSFVTHYSIGARIATYYMKIVNSATTLMFPVFSKLEGQHDYDQIREKFTFVTKLTVIFSVYVSGILIIYGKAFITRWMGTAYTDAYNILAILIIGILFNTIQMASAALLYGLSRHRFYSIVVCSEGVANLLLSMLLVGRYGIAGVAMGTTIPLLVTNILIIPVYTCRVIGIGLGRYVRGVLCAAALGAAVHAGSWFVIRDAITSSYPRLLILGVSTSAVYLILNAFIMLRKHERMYFKIPF